jgi:hypothetical protein
MLVSHDTQKMAQKFNDDEAVWQEFTARKRLRELLGTVLPMAEETADALDWQWAERTARPVRAVGFPMP